MKYRTTLITVLAAMLCACGKEPSRTPAIAETVQKYREAVSLEGMVSGNSGPLKEGKVEARTLKGELLAESILENSPRFHLEIAAGTALPFVLTYTAPPETQQTEKMFSIAIQPTISKYDINPLTTAIANKAKALGGYTLRNLRMAAEDSVHVPDANKTSSGFRGDPTTQYGGWH